MFTLSISVVKSLFLCFLIVLSYSNISFCICPASVAFSISNAQQCFFFHFHVTFSNMPLDAYMQSFLRKTSIRR